MTFDWNALVVEPFNEMIARIAGFIPNLLGALLILIIGWILAKIIKVAVTKLLSLVKFDVLADKAGISNVLEKGEIKLTTTQLIGILVYWLVMIMVLIMVVNALGLTVASQLLDGLLGYIPKVIAAVFVIVLGLFLANLVSGAVFAAASNADLPKPNVLKGVSKWAIVVFAVTVSLRQLGIAPLLVGTTFNILFGSICLALALAFGLGGREAASKYIDELMRK